MKKRLMIGMSLILAFIGLTSCARYASEKDLDHISLYMDKQKVMERMSSKGVARGSIANKYGQVIEVREYKVQSPKTGRQVGGDLAFTVATFGLGAPILLTGGDINTYWLYFCDGQLVQWGRAGDWVEAQKMIYDINFKISSD